MAKEIERKFLVVGDRFIAMSQQHVEIRQGYISRRPEGTVRVRIFGDKAFLTVKGKNRGAVRSEWEYAVPVTDAMDMLAEVADGAILRKTRYYVPFADRTWEVDVFHGSHEGLITAEVELPSADAEVSLPPFVGEEVTGDSRYYNSNLG
ncbi:MAG: CYTH domain-containing protein [Muribaculaceae bacterium]|nr:CYTH domain-containing protein [Muribaculaceae bacterium]